MPNWCTNQFNANCDDPIKFKEFLDKAITKDSEGNETFCFNNLFPMPDELNITSGSSTDNGRDIIKAKEMGDWSGIDQKLEWPAWTGGLGFTESTSLDEKRKIMLAHMEEKMVDSNAMAEARQSLRNEKIYGCKDWYDWRVKNWSTKWDIGNDVTISHTETGFNATFDTAWSPPLNWMEKVSQDFPEIEFQIEYDEPGMDFSGEIHMLAGEVIYQEEGESKAWADSEEDID